MSILKTVRQVCLVSFSLWLGIIFVTACNSNTSPTQSLKSNEPNQAQQGSASATPDPDETAVPTSDGKPTATLPPNTIFLEIGTARGAKDFKYDKQMLEAHAGFKIKLKFINNTDPRDEVGHNWVLVKPGQEEAVIASGKAAGDDKDWLDIRDPNIIAHTRLIEGNQNHTITFDAPSPGTYVFLSTFPEQYARGMKGILTIK